MRKLNQYKWLIVVEGLTDVKTYEQLLVRFGVDKSLFKLFVDSDEDDNSAFDSYKQNADIPYIPTMREKVDNVFWRLDTINGVSIIPILGISVPCNNPGCLETDLLTAYGFPVEGQEEYIALTDLVKKTSRKWNIPKHSDGKEWWEVNEKAKLDKFLYLSFSHGFEVCHENVDMPVSLPEPKIIENIRTVMQACIT